MNLNRQGYQLLLKMKLTGASAEPYLVLPNEDLPLCLFSLGKVALVTSFMTVLSMAQPAN